MGFAWHGVASEDEDLLVVAGGSWELLLPPLRAALPPLPPLPPYLPPRSRRPPLPLVLISTSPPSTSALPLTLPPPPPPAPLPVLGSVVELSLLSAA